MSRKKPTEATIKKLFALSGNQCAFPDCEQPIINSDGDLIGQVCHIAAAEVLGQRYDANQDDEQRRSFENLILMCANHHKETDNTNLYTVEKLLQIKKNHEQSSFARQKKVEPSKKIIQEAQQQASTSQNIKNQASINQQSNTTQGNIIIQNGLTINETTALFENISKIIVASRLEDKPENRKYSKPKPDFKKYTQSKSPKIFIHEEKGIYQVEKTITDETENQSLSINQVDQVFSDKNIYNTLKPFEAVKQDQIVDLEKQKANDIFDLGKIYQQAALTHKAQNTFELANQLDPENTQVLLKLAELHIERQEYEQAEIKLNQLIPKYAKLNNWLKIILVYNYLAYIYKQRINYTKSLKFLKMARELCIDSNFDPELGPILRRIGFVSLVNGDIKKAKNQMIMSGKILDTGFDLEIPIEPKKSDMLYLYNDLAVLYAVENSYDKSCVFLSSALNSLEKTNQISNLSFTNRTILHINFAISNMYLGNVQEAVGAAQHAKEITQEFLGYEHSILGHIYGILSCLSIMRHEGIKAEREFYRSIEIGEKQTSRENQLKKAALYAHRGNVFKKLGNEFESDKSFKLSLNILTELKLDTSLYVKNIKSNFEKPKNQKEIILAL
jgi:tetratricopeptide (TPR) repeat protein